ncbi:hypothetical protein Tco_0144171 [Tanacetum coccineum]
MLGPGRYSQWRSRFLRRMKSIPAAQHHTTNYEHLFQRVDACNTSKRRCGLAIGKATSGLIIERTRCKDQSVLGNLEVYFLVMENPCSRNTHGFYKLKNELTGTTCKLGLMQVNVQFLQQPQTRMVKVVTLVKLKKKDTDLHITDYLTSPQAVSEGVTRADDTTPRIALTARIWALRKGMAGSQSGLKTTRITKENKMMIKQVEQGKDTGGLTWKIQFLTGQPLEQIGMRKGSKIVKLILCHCLTLDAQEHITGNLKQFCNFVDKYLGTETCSYLEMIIVLQFLVYGYLIQGNVRLKRVLLRRRPHHNSFPRIGQILFNADLELLTGNLLIL